MVVELSSLLPVRWRPIEKSGQGGGRRSSHIAAACLLLALAPLASRVSAQVQDQVFESGTPTRCSILQVSRDSLRVSDKGQQREIPVNTIRKVVFGNEPNELKSARDRVRDGRYEAALEVLQKLDVSSVKRDLVKRDVAYFRALLRARLAMSTSGNKKTGTRCSVRFHTAESTDAPLLRSGAGTR